MGNFLSKELLTWHDALTIAAFIFAITQFMENSRLRRYIFYLGWFRTITVILVAIPLVSIIISSFTPKAVYSLFSYPISFLGQYLTYIFFSSFPFIPKLNIITVHFALPKEVWQIIYDAATYQIIALISFTLLLFLFLLFLRFPQFFKPFFGEGFLQSMEEELLDNLRTEDLAALSKIIGSYLDKIISLASTVQRPFGMEPSPQPRTKKEKLAVSCLQFIDDLSEDNFIVYIARENLKFIVWVINYAKKYRLWNAGGDIFFENLFDQLIKDENSVLTKELKLAGYRGIVKPLSNFIFNSLEVVENYNVFGVLGWGAEVSEITLTNVIAGLKISLTKYFTTDRGSYIGNPSMSLGRTIENLSECHQRMCMEIVDKGEEIWRSAYASKASKITSFFDNFEQMLTPTLQNEWRREAYTPVLSNEELSAQQYTVTEGIINGFFQIIEGYAWLKNESYSRMQMVDIYWLFFHTTNIPAIQTIQNKLLEKIKERVEENFKNQYPSMLRLFLNLYGGELYGDLQSNNPIALYFREIFKSRVVPQLRKNQKFREHNMPSDWLFDKQKNIYRMFYGDKKIIIDTAKKTSKKPKGKPISARRKVKKKYGHTTRKKNIR